MLRTFSNFTLGSKTYQHNQNHKQSMLKLACTSPKVLEMVSRCIVEIWHARGQENYCGDYKPVLHSILQNFLKIGFLCLLHPGTSRDFVYVKAACRHYSPLLRQCCVQKQKINLHEPLKFCNLLNNVHRSAPYMFIGSAGFSMYLAKRLWHMIVLFFTTNKTWCERPAK